ncbi:MAG: hypothetical protein ACI3ZR_05870 [bacterium]
MENTLEILFPDQEVKVGEKNYTLRPFTLGDIPKVIKIMSKMFQYIFPKIDILETAIITDENEEKKLVLGPEHIICLAEVLEEGSEDIFKLMSVATKIEEKEIVELPIDIGVMLLAKVIELNWNFFMNRLKPFLAELAKKLQQKSKK